MTDVEKAEPALPEQRKEGDSERLRLEAERDLTREELRETVAALASKADLSSRSKEAVHEYVKGAQDMSTRVGHYTRQKISAPGVPASGQLLAAASVAVLAFVILRRLRSQSRGLPRPDLRGRGRHKRRW